jgi:hypothetical protein
VVATTAVVTDLSRRLREVDGEWWELLVVVVVSGGDGGGGDGPLASVARGVWWVVGGRSWVVAGGERANPSPPSRANTREVGVEMEVEAVVSHWWWGGC